MSSKKEYLLREDGRIKECPSNIAKMNMYECFKHFNIFSRYFKALIPEKEELEYLVVFLIRLVVVFTLPLSMILILVISVLIKIKKAKKEVNEWEARQNKDSKIDNDILLMFESWMFGDSSENFYIVEVGVNANVPYTILYSSVEKVGLEDFLNCVQVFHNKKYVERGKLYKYYIEYDSRYSTIQKVLYVVSGVSDMLSLNNHDTV
jgi:hypothetical protein